MDAIRYFKDRAKAELRGMRAAGAAELSLQQVQHRVAVSAGYRSWSELVQAEEPNLRLAAVMDQEPDLNRNGFGLGSMGKTPHERRARAAEFREELRTRAEYVDDVRRWLIENITPRKTLNHDAFSYSLKHTAERDMGQYVANGELIAAAVIVGYPYRRRPGSLNAIFGMSSRSITLLRRPR